MRHRHCLALVVLTALIATTPAQAQHNPGTFGIGVTVNGSDPGFNVSLASPPLIFEPTFAMQARNRDSRNERYVAPAIGLLYQFRHQNDFRPHLGVRFGVDYWRLYYTRAIYYSDVPYFYETTEKKTYWDIVVGPVFGARYYLSDHLAVSGEFQVVATFFDQGEYSRDYRNVGELSVSTSQLVAAYFYF